MIINKICLCGKWDLFYNTYEISTDDFSVIEKNYNKTDANVPGNFEIDFANAGLCDVDLYNGMNTRLNEKLEGYDWWYKKEFITPEIPGGCRAILSFGAVDCFADYYVNGKKVYHSENAFIEQRIDVTDAVKGIGKNNILCVHIKSAVREVYKNNYNMYLGIGGGLMQSFVRKPAHSFGWDIFPRAVSGGIWRDVNIEVTDSINFAECGYFVKSANEDKAVIAIHTDVDAPYEEFGKKVEVRVSGKCGESEFCSVFDLNHFKICHKAVINIKNPKLWWPYGYGEANVYDVKFELLFDGIVKDIKEMNMGIRTVELKRRKTLLENDSDFRFVINGTDIMCRGTNWVPLDAYHSRDAQRYVKALELIKDTGCNILRIWGGGVYEQDKFFDWCDRNGVMVWQDFMIACMALSHNEKLVANLKNEAEFVVKKFRNHPSIVLWCGDNEIDEILMMNGINSDINIINRKILKDVVAQNDIGRPYLESSPYISGKYFEAYKDKKDVFPERHLWGARDYYKAGFYSNSNALFVSEVGYHGCPCVESIRKMIDKDSVWPIYNEQWILHSSDQRGDDARVRLMDDQIVQLFGFRAENIEDFSLASQISQAEAVKFFIERIRAAKPEKTGIIWWNMLDGWPQMSDAVVDYYFNKKIAYDFIKRIQKPFAIVINEMSDWKMDVVAVNDTLNEVKGSFRVFDIESEDVFVQDEFKVMPNGKKVLSEVNLMYSDKKFLAIEWNINGEKFYNHYCTGMPPYDFEYYKKMLKKFNGICGDISANIEL